MEDEMQRQLFVGNLPFSVGWQDLKDVFREAGAVVRADVAVNPGGRSRGFGTVLFSTTAEAQAAIARFNGYEWDNRSIQVCRLLLIIYRYGLAIFSHPRYISLVNLSRLMIYLFNLSR